MMLEPKKPIDAEVDRYRSIEEKALEDEFAQVFIPNDIGEGFASRPAT